MIDNDNCIIYDGNIMWVLIDNDNHNVIVELMMMENCVKIPPLPLLSNNIANVLYSEFLKHTIYDC